MATLSLRMRDDLKQKAQQLAKEQGVSLNGFINATLADTIAQQETLTFFCDRLNDLDQETLHRRVLKFMRKSQRGKEPSVEEIERAMKG
jgi:antitoxin component of RelBE/YafQ-DinJ toxin-antitoxin module